MTEPLGEAGRGDGELYVITLCTASLPMILRVPFVHELVGFSVFRSRTVEEGRERFRLYVGYFDSATRAHEALTVVRRHYPAAWISTAPRKNLGSLDDTMNTAFRMIRRASARVVEGSEAVQATPATADTSLPPEPAETPATTDAQPQRYVVQLDWSPTPVPSAAIPQLALLRAYHLYRAQLSRDDGRHHALRLGFFKNVHGARQVAEYLRAYFPRVGVVPISQREYTRALELFEERSAQGAAAPESVSGGSLSPLLQVPVLSEQPAASTVHEPSAAAQASEPVQRTREQILALLGADQFELDEGSGSLMTGDTADASPAPPVAPRNSNSW